MQFWNLLAILSFAITGVFSASASIRHHEATRRVLDAKDYQIVLDAWRERLKDDYQVRGLAEAKIISGNVFLTGCNFNGKKESPPMIQARTLTDFFSFSFYR